ncbi:hypothetical protein CVIRNUC_000225 [Coccomyxa viridis]|uniref:Uncharacterized protein n=1 Tax=Coccomyxa viridis TaxID=1274662 RepID=A0AAV1HPL0_9CHLO|nr:hypothetical protein CVIRNUC_000225 [Coccomyxa viridis]
MACRACWTPYALWQCQQAVLRPLQLCRRHNRPCSCCSGCIAWPQAVAQRNAEHSTRLKWRAKGILSLPINSKVVETEWKEIVQHNLDNLTKLTRQERSAGGNAE